MVQFYPLTNVMLTCVVHVSTLHSTCQHYICKRVKLDHFGYFKGKIVPSVSLGCPVVQGGYLKGKIGPLPKNLISFNCCDIYLLNISSDSGGHKLFFWNLYGKVFIPYNPVSRVSFPCFLMSTSMLQQPHIE